MTKIRIAVLLAFLAVPVSAADVSGTWNMTINLAGIPELTCSLSQKPQQLDGMCKAGGDGVELNDGRVDGDQVSWTWKITTPDKVTWTYAFTGTLDAKGDAIKGTVKLSAGPGAKVNETGFTAQKLSSVLTAQDKRPAFEVVSIKPTPPGTQGGSFQLLPGGRVTWRNTTLMGLVAATYQRFLWDSREIVGGPDWVNEARFDVTALSPGGLPPVDADGFPSQLLAMFRDVLADRFRLVAHWEKRERPMYNLVLERADRRLGPKLVPVAMDCAKVGAAILAGSPPVSRPGRGQECNFSLTSDYGSLQGNAVTIAALARFLAAEGLEREVVDRTSLSGRFDVDLLHMPEHPVGGIPPDRLALDPRFQGRPGLSTALREQLGLRLEATRGLVEVLVIDSVERPTPD